MEQRTAEAAAIDAASAHVPVMLDRCVELMTAGTDPADASAVFVDATLGMGGHTEALLRARPEARVISIDRDPQALALAAGRLEPFGQRSIRVQARYDQISEVLADFGVETVQGILMDLGVSSLQLDRPERGFAYSYDAPLDMRMDNSTGLSAAEVLNTYSAEDLERILRVFGQEKFARRIASRIVQERSSDPFSGSSRLVELIRDSIPAATRRTGGNPAKRTFQALRIEVNAELESLQLALPAAVDALAVGGRIVVMSYQSLEDRLVKHELAHGATDATPHHLPVPLEEAAPRLELLTKGAERPSEAELERNPRSAPARLRAAVRVRPGRLAAPGSPRKNRPNHQESSRQGRPQRKQERS